jgi:MFS family permease
VFLGVGYVGFTLMPTAGSAVAILAIAFIGGGAPTSAGSAAVVSLAPAHMRAQIVALYYFTLNFVGFMLGPTAVALLTDHFFHDRDMLRWSLAIVAGVSVTLGMLALLYNRPHFRAAIAEARAA